MTTPSGDELFVNYGSLEQIAENIKGQADKLKEDLGEIQSKMGEVAHIWEGEAQTAYQTVQTKWNQNVDEVHQALTAIVSKVHIASGDYSSTDKKAAAQFGM
ncbi:WXG100 family type VII secretion target [Streptomyces xiaopingdaonensis]|uniref:WXG100 family type VII secretion target n=1 Tax=Streptomyces xiaopingdaonensis TaxID=1565415 RepID=UPI0002F1FFB3|nr:WXG100 family type VII secretion target [Streptomyces xiaopingdaonensis]